MPKSGGYKEAQPGFGGADRLYKMIKGQKRIPLTKAKTKIAFLPLEFQRRLGAWYREHARELPWRGISDPYATWVSEIMLQQTRVATVIDHYEEFLKTFPTIAALAKADEDDVLALWSGLGYYRRARMLYRGAQFVQRELDGRLPSTEAELRTLPGVGEYTAAAIASIAFGQSVAVLDGNVERVLLRLLGEAESNSGQMRARLQGVAQMLVPLPKGKGNAPGDHNQAMMELGATICLPRSPLCLQCPVVELCATRGEHITSERTKMQSRTVAYLLTVRKRGLKSEVLLERRPKEASLMAGMLELPPLPVEVTEHLEPVLRLRHAITVTNFYVRVFAEGATGAGGRPNKQSLRRQIPAAAGDLHWVETTKLAQMPLTGLARKVLQRLDVMAMPKLKID